MNQLTLAISLCVVLVACGGGGGGGNPDTQPPVVISLDPPNNAIGADVDDSISVVFNEAIDATSVTTTSFTLQPASGGSAIAGARTVSGSTVRFVPTAALAPSTLYTATIAGTVRDAAGNSLGANTAWNFTTETDAWQATARDAGTPTSRTRHTAIWTGQAMIIWGGTTSGVPTATGARYQPAVGAAPGVWTATTQTGAPSARSGHTAVWTGMQMIVWGGIDISGNSVASGAQYMPGSGASEGWITTTAIGAPSARSGHTATWIGSEMIVWGGVPLGGVLASDGARYTPGPTGGSWAAMSSAQAPSARERHTAVWTGTELVVWGGRNQGGATASGARYNPTTNTWSAISAVGAPTARFDHEAIWTGKEMIVWGGTFDGVTPLNTGGRYDPAANTWNPVSTTGVALGRIDHTLTWTGLEMVVWGGNTTSGLTNSGLRYRPSTDSWKTMTDTDAPTARSAHTAIWTGQDIVVWGGDDGLSTVDGGQYAP